MPLKLIRQDITKVECDAIVNAANGTLLGGGGVDGAIHRAAGPDLLAECRTLGGCKTGEAKVTKGYRLPARYVIHTVGPVWSGGKYGEEELLRSCYRNSLKIAAELGLESIAFPLISAGVYGYPKAEALRVALEEIWAFLSERDMLVWMVIFDKDSTGLAARFYPELRQYVSDEYAAEAKRRDGRTSVFANRAPMPVAGAAMCFDKESLAEELDAVDESFSRMLLRKIDERGMTDAQCYKRANIDRKLFSKIRSDPCYRPSKPTAMAFAVALELPIAEARELLMKAGYAFSRASKFDIIVEYFIKNGVYDVMEINEALFSFDQPLLG